MSTQSRPGLRLLAPLRRFRAAIAAVAVVVMLGALAPAALAAEVGTVSGHVTDDGTPVGGAWVTVYDTSFSWIAATSTDDAGGFSLDIPPGDYKLSFQVGSRTQWSFQKTSFDSADIITVVTDQITTVDEQMLPHGTVAGHFTDDGAPVAGAVVTLYDIFRNPVGAANVDDTGAFSIDAVPGDYKLEFQVDGLTQWSSQKSSFETADIITVVADQLTTVDEELLSHGTITGQLTDHGSPVTGAWAYLYDTAARFVGTARVDDTGAFTFVVPPGDYKLNFWFDDRSQWSSQKTSFETADIITVVADQVTTVNEEVLPHGTISGHLTNNGAPVAGAFVTVYDTDFAYVASTSVDEEGAFSVDVPAGDYKIEFQAGNHVQWSAQKTSFEAADIVTVVADDVTTVEEQLLPVATIAGRVTRADGTPAAFAQVTASMDDPPFASSSTTTDENGDYTMLVPPGEYRVQFRRDFDSPTQWANNARSSQDAALITAAAGETVTLNQQLLPVGTLSGVLTMADGVPIASAGVTAIEVSTGDTEFAFTDAEGRYQLTMFGGEYVLRFSTRFGTQWATGRSSAELTDPITVGEGEMAYDETLAPLGTVSITAVDSVTGAPVAGFCAGLSVVSACTETGTVTFDALPGRYLLIPTPRHDDYLSPEPMQVEVTSGVTTEVVLHMTPAARVSTTIIDRQTGVPVANACVELVGVTSPSSLGIGGFRCSDDSGVVALTGVAGGSYKAFVWARDGVHGHQWVGNSGGVGQFDKARTVTIPVGRVVTLPAIRLDRAGGDITGTVTDEVTGAPVTQGTAWISSFNSGFGPVGSTIDEQGHYTISDLGPYQWEVFFAAPPYAYEWSGDAGARAKAKTVKVKLDTTVIYDTSVGAGTTVSGVITDPTGQAASAGRIIFLDAATGDEIAVDDIFDAPVPGQYVAQVKGPQRVKVSCSAIVDGQFYGGLVGGATFAEATSFTIPAGGTLTLDITATQLGR